MAYIYPFKTVAEATKLAVWKKGQPIDGSDSAMWRRDKCGRNMKYTDHGDTNSSNGWEIDHIVPTSRGGKDLLDNLQPLQWENNREKSDTYPWNCV